MAPPTPPLKNTQRTAGKPAVQADALGSEDARLDMFGGDMPLNDTQARLARERLWKPAPVVYPRIVKPHPEYLDKPSHVPDASVAVPDGFRGPSHGLKFNATEEANARKARRREAAWTRITRKDAQRARGLQVDSSDDDADDDVPLPAYMKAKAPKPATTVAGVRHGVAALGTPGALESMGGTRGGAGRFVGRDSTLHDPTKFEAEAAALRAAEEEQAARGKRKAKKVYELDDAEDGGGSELAVKNPLAARKRGSGGGTTLEDRGGALLLHTSPRGGDGFKPRSRGKSERRGQYRGGARSKWRPPTPPSDHDDDAPSVYTADMI